MLNYYEFKQIPNFLLASPIIFLSSWGIIAYLGRFSFFEQPPGKGGNARSPILASPYFDASMLPFIVYWALLVIVGVLFMHVQVLTRFLSACPPVYWFCASFYDRDDEETETKKREGGVRRRMQYLIAFYFLAYSLVGALLFCNFYPWT